MSKVNPNQEAVLVDLSDDELKSYLLATHEAVKNLEEQKRTDPELQQMREALKAYENDNFNEEIRYQKARLKAARSLAKARKLNFKLPGDK